MTVADLKESLDRLINDRELPHVDRIAIAAAIIAEALRLNGMDATLVGGGAIEVHAPDVYSTTDIDFIVEGRDRVAIGKVLVELNLIAQGRHWVRDDIYVEVPGTWMPDPTEYLSIGLYKLKVVKKEIVLADRIIGFKHWKYSSYGIQAATMLTVFGDNLDESLLLTKLRQENAEDAYRGIRNLMAKNEELTPKAMEHLIEQLHNK